MITVVKSSRDMYNYTANPQTRAMLNNYCANSMSQFVSHNYTNPYQQGTQLYQLVENAKASAISGVEHSDTPEIVIARTQSMLNYAALNNRDAFNQIYQIGSIAEIPLINPTIQQYVMSDPSLAEAYDKGMIDGYSSTYLVDDIQKDAPYTERYSHHDVYNGMLQFDEDGDGYVEWWIEGDTLDTDENRLELSPGDQVEVMSLIKQIKLAKAKGIDLTRQ